MSSGCAAIGDSFSANGAVASILLFKQPSDQITIPNPFSGGDIMKRVKMVAFQLFIVAVTLMPVVMAIADDGGY